MSFRLAVSVETRTAQCGNACVHYVARVSCALLPEPLGVFSSCLPASVWQRCDVYNAEVGEKSRLMPAQANQCMPLALDFAVLVCSRLVVMQRKRMLKSCLDWAGFWRIHKGWF